MNGVALILSVAVLVVIALSASWWVAEATVTLTAWLEGAAP